MTRNATILWHFRICGVILVPLQGVGTLQEVKVPIISQSLCQEMYSLDPKDKVDILYDMICAGYQEGGKDSCQVLLIQLFVQTHKSTLASHIKFLM